MPSDAVRIAPLAGLRPLDPSELWRFRHLFRILVWRDVSIRYKQTLLGVAWAVIQPLALMLCLTLFFGRWSAIPSGGVPYHYFSYVALVFWGLFARGMSTASTSLVTHEGIITKVYFPRCIVPAAAVTAGILDFLLALAAVLPFLLWHGALGPAVVFLPVVVLVLLSTVLGVSLVLSVLDAVYRDVRHILPFATQILFFASPIIYPLDLVPASLRTLIALNPMTGIIEAARWCLIGYPRPPANVLLLSSGAAVFLLVLGILFFQRWERQVVDRI